VAAPSALLDGRAQLVLPGLQPHLGGLDCRLRLNQKIGWMMSSGDLAAAWPGRPVVALTADRAVIGTAGGEVTFYRMATQIH
jgi:hypothetical protein